MLNLEELNVPVSTESPSGENQEYNQLYLQLDELAAGTPPSQMGDSISEGKDPDWRQLRQNCLTLWKETRDLRVGVYLCVAELCLEGLAGFNQALEVLNDLVTEQWDTFYPQLDPEDDNDPLERLNILSMISPQSGSYNDPVMFIMHFRNLKLAPGLKYSLRDYLIANGELDAGDEKLDLNLLHAEAMGVPLSVLEEQARTVQRTEELLNGICETVNAKVTGAYTLNFSALQHELKHLAQFYAKHLQSENTASAPEDPAPETESGNTSAAARPEIRTSAAFDLATFRASTRSEALLLLRKSAEYFQISEPTSPVPFLINRALRVAEMNFMDLLADIAPDAVDRGRDILGVKREDENPS